MNKHEEHQWEIRVDRKMVIFFLGQQSEYTKHFCLLCLWGSRAKNQHWDEEDCPLRNLMIEENQT